MARNPADILSQLSILVVDDNVHARHLMRTVLRALGVKQTVTAEDGEEALHLLEGRSPVNVLICDWMMPNMPGIELVRRIRQPTNDFAFLPIIIASAFADVRRVSLARDSGADEFLVKPIAPAALYSRLLAVSTRRRPFVRTDTYFGPDRRRNKGNAYQGQERRIADDAALITPPPTVEERLPALRVARSALRDDAAFAAIS